MVPTCRRKDQGCHFCARSLECFILFWQLPLFEPIPTIIDPFTGVLGLRKQQQWRTKSGLYADYIDECGQYFFFHFMGWVTVAGAPRSTKTRSNVKRMMNQTLRSQRKVRKKKKRRKKRNRPSRTHGTVHVCLKIYRGIACFPRCPSTLSFEH